jgi:hypothetical protein
MNAGLCPKCDAVVANVKTENVVIGVPPFTQWNGISYVCTRCNYVLGIQIDPISLRHDTVNMIVDALRKK